MERHGPQRRDVVCFGPIVWLRTRKVAIPRRDGHLGYCRIPATSLCRAQLQTTPMFAPGSASRRSQPLPSGMRQAPAKSGSAITIPTKAAFVRFVMILVPPLVTRGPGRLTAWHSPQWSSCALSTSCQRLSQNHVPVSPFVPQRAFSRNRSRSTATLVTFPAATRPLSSCALTVNMKRCPSTFSRHASARTVRPTAVGEMCST